MSKLNLTKRLLLFGLVTFLAGQIFFYPFNTDFRLSLSPGTFAFILLYFSKTHIIASSTAVGLSVFIGRFLLEVLNHNYAVSDIIIRHYPGGMYYIVYGLFFYFLDIRKNNENPLLIIALLTIIDTLSNLVELNIRNQIFNNIQLVISSLILIGLLRSFFTVLLYWFINFYNVLILKKAHFQRYIELLMLISNLKAELFYLKKSMQDIEKVMQNSYSLYMALNDFSEEEPPSKIGIYKQKALILARDIHEIKKDYQRVTAGIEKLLPNTTEYEKMSISEIFTIIRNNCSRYIQSTAKDIRLKFTTYDNFETKKYYSIVSILNNLIFNAIDATPQNGEIRIKEYLKDGQVIIVVSDDGHGISPSDLEVIFEPGFSTKFNENTGAISTGLGLTHSRSIVEHLRGTISVRSSLNNGTTFTIGIPGNELISKGER